MEIFKKNVVCGFLEDLSVIKSHKHFAFFCQKKKSFLFVLFFFIFSFVYFSHKTQDFSKLFKFDYALFYDSPFRFFFLFLLFWFLFLDFFSYFAQLFMDIYDRRSISAFYNVFFSFPIFRFFLSCSNKNLKLPHW